MIMERFLAADWPAPHQVEAYTTLRCGGYSRGDYDSFNIAMHVGDNPDHVVANRDLLKQELALPNDPLWLHQVHGTRVIEAGQCQDPRADGMVCFGPGKVCAVLTADCVPVFFCDRDATRVGIAHAGWRGLAAGIIEETITALQCCASELMVWLGPAIGPHAYQVGDEVREVFVANDDIYAPAFLPDGLGTWRADLYCIVHKLLVAAGVEDIHGGGCCTYTDSQRFYSFRRDNRTGRMASLIWLVE